MRRFLYALVLLAAVVFAVSQFNEFQHSLDTLRLGAWYWLAVAAVFEAVYLVNFAAAYRAAFRMVGLDDQLGRLFPLALAANFVNVITATGGLAGMAVFVSDARRRGVGTAQVTLGGILFVLADYVSVLFILALGFAVLLQRNSLSAGDLAAAGVLVVAAAVLGGLLALGLQSAQRLGNVLAGAAHFGNRLLRPLWRREVFSEESARNFAAGAAEGFKALRGQAKIRWLVLVGHALAAKALLMGVLWLVFLAFGQPVSPEAIIAAFSLTYLFLIVSPTPSGLGVVEGVMTLALRTLGVPLGPAALITLAYRGITFWLPFVAGFIAWRWVAWRPRAPLTPPAAEV